MSYTVNMRDIGAIFGMDIGVYLNEDCIVAPATVPIQDPCPLALPDIVPLAHASVQRRFMKLGVSLKSTCSQPK